MVLVAMERLRCRLSLILALVVAAFVGAGAIALTPGQSEAQSNRPLLVEHKAAAALAAPTAVRAVEPSLAVAAATPPPPPPPPNPVPPLPTPAGLPNPSTRVALTEIGRIQIPKIGLDDVVREGVEQMVIDAGPAHWPGTAAFGSWGNIVLAGHRTNGTSPFLRVGELAPGDKIVLSDPSGTYTYHVTGLEVVPNTALWIVDQKPGRTLTMFTCHPIGSATQRLIVRAELMSTPRPGQ